MKGKKSGSATPSGSVQFFYGTYSLGRAGLMNGSISITAKTAGIVPGTYPLMASYSGDTNYAPSVSSPASITISPYMTRTVLTLSSSTVDEGALDTLKVTVTEVNGTAKPTGTVTILVNNAAVSTLPLVNGVASVQASTAGYAAGAYTLTASYSGDQDNAKSTSAAVIANIIGTTTTTLSFGAIGYAVGQTATVSAKVIAPSGGSPSGTVKFSLGSSVFATAQLSSGVARITAPTTGLAAGTYHITATYEGSSEFQPSSGSASAVLDPAYVISPGGAALAPAATRKFSLSPAPNGTVTWFVNGVAGGNSTAGTVDANGTYSAPATSVAVTASITARVSSAPTYTTPAVSAYTIPAGVVAKTTNPYVASYTINVPQGASVSVNFGQTTSYGLNTWKQTAPTGGGNVTMEVAGMIGGHTYHLQGLVNLPKGVNYTDVDQQFQVAGLGGANFPSMHVAVNNSPSPGIELTDNLNYDAVPTFAIDLDGNVIWAYQGTDFSAPSILHPVKMLPNGHLLMMIGVNSELPLNGGVPANAVQLIREVDLVGNVIQQVTLSTINANLVDAGYQNVQLLAIHHELTALPNGHWLFVGNMIVPETGLTGYSGTVNVLGDVVVDIDPANNFAVDWVWNEFDHLDLNRHPMNFPDWTHTNAIVYVPGDGNLLISIRHQNWVVKVNYDNGNGDGSILWHFGAQGDFTLENSSSDLDWQYAQHLPSFTTPDTTGVFGLTLMDNGDDRGVYDNALCGTGSNPACYSTLPNFTIDENNMTVTKTFAGIYPSSYYSNFGGNAELLANGNLEGDFCAYVNNGNPTSAMVLETTQGADPAIVWQLFETGENFYRAFRLGSLYPGVTWSPGAGITEASRMEHRLKPGETPAIKAPLGTGPASAD